MNVKLDDFYLGVLINGLSKYTDSFSDNTELDNTAFLLRLIDEYEHLKPKHKVKLALTPEETKLVRICLITWRNEEIQTKKEVAVEVISEVLAKFL